MPRFFVAGLTGRARSLGRADAHVGAEGRRRADSGKGSIDVGFEPGAPSALHGSKPLRVHSWARKARKDDSTMADRDYILTEEGKAKLEEELHYLETEKRAEIGERIKVAREFGDISENSEYDDAKNEQGMMEARIAEITRILGEATVVTTPKRSNRVNIGSVVTVNMGGRERVFTIVGGAEADAAAGKISNESPVGAALLGHKKGDTVSTVGPTGREINMEVLKIEH